MITRSRSSLGFNPIICWSVMHWASTPRGTQCLQRKKTLRTWTLAFFAVLHWLTQKALQDRQVIGQLYRLLTDGLHEGARVLVAMMTHHIGQRTQAFLG